MEEAGDTEISEGTTGELYFILYGKKPYGGRGGWGKVDILPAHQGGLGGTPPYFSELYV